MLWGYTAQQLTDGGAKKLVDNLDHASSDFRIAAIENLKAITGHLRCTCPISRKPNAAPRCSNGVRS